MIPKIIHYCWFGSNEKSEKIKKCIESWKKYLPDYEIKEWNENNFDLNICNYVKDAYAAKKWAHVSDYTRAFALYHEGGIYLDTDVEIKRSLDEFLTHGAFSGFEMKGFCFTALWGASKNHHWPKKVLEYYEKKEFSLETNTVSITKILEEEYKINKNIDELQNYNQDIYIYPSNYFCLDIPNYAVHHFEGSWLNKSENHNWKDYIHKKHAENEFLKSYNNFHEAFNFIKKEFKIRDIEILVFILKKILKNKWKIK